MPGSPGTMVSRSSAARSDDPAHLNVVTPLAPNPDTISCRMIRPTLAILLGSLLGCVSTPERVPACSQYALAMMGLQGEIISGTLLVSSGGGPPGSGELRLLLDASNTNDLAALLRRKLTAGRAPVTVAQKGSAWVVRLLPEVEDDVLFLAGSLDGEGITGSITHATEAGPKRVGWFLAVCQR